MTPDQWEKVSEIFHQAVELEGAERASLIKRECSGDIELRREVESLLSAHTDADGFIEQPVADLSSLSTDEMPSLAGTTFGHYKVENSIGRGGMGEVYRALDTKLNRKVALKKLPDEFVTDPSFLKRFQHEAQAAATLNHPNVATIYSVEEFEGKPFITMEYVDGKTLEAVTPGAGLDLRVFLDWFIQLSGALRHAHERGITHRDIKPGNIMVTANGIPKILDFGLAQTSRGNYSVNGISDSLTEPGRIMGTPSYMSPEQAEGKEIDHRSDIFSFGVVMYEALTGIRPFTGDSNAELVSNLLKEDPPLVSEIRSEVPSLIARLVARCLAKQRNDRLQNMQEVRTILAEARAVLRAGTSTLSFGRRLYGEASTGSALWRAAAAFVVILASFAGWYFFPRENRSPFTFENLSIRRLSQSQNVVYAHISPDGKSVAYNTIEVNEDRSMWIRRIDDRNALRLVGPQPVQYWGGLEISADGGQIYYITADRLARHGTLYRISSLGGTPRKLVETVNDLGSLSRDGKRILFVRYGEAVSILSANAEDGSGEQVHATVPNGSILRDPQFSPDGRSIFYIKLERIDGVEFWSLVTRPVEGGDEVVVLPAQRERLSEIAFTDDPNSLLLNSAEPETNRFQLSYVSLPDGKLTRITNDLNSYFGVSVDRKGNNIVSAQRYQEKRIWVGDLSDLSNMRAVSPEANAYLKVDWTPDGRIVFDAADNNRPHIWICDDDGQNCQQLTPNGSDDSQPAVSRDGQYVVFTSTRGGFNQVWRMNIDGSNQVLLANVEGLSSDPRFAPDGNTVIFHWVQGTRRMLGKVPVEGGPSVEMPLYGDSHWTLSPDGAMVAYTVWDDKDERSKVAIRPVDADQPITYLNVAPTHILKWRYDGNALIYKERQAGDQPHATVMEWIVGSSEHRELISVEPEYVLDFTYSRDGKKAAIIRGKLITDAILLSRRSPVN